MYQEVRSLRPRPGRYYRQHHRIFPYHLGHYICRVLRVSPFKYYSDLCYSSLAAEMSFSELPNFTVSTCSADCLRFMQLPIDSSHQLPCLTAAALTYRRQTWFASWASVG